jgi:polysaccharide biosynthesis protein PslG
MVPCIDPPAPPAFSVGNAPSVDPGVATSLWGHPSTTNRDLALAGDGGFRWVKQQFEWRNIERDGKGQFLRDEPDRIIQAISQRGLKLSAQVDYQPQWAAKAVTFPSEGPPDSLSDWHDFVDALASRYTGHIHAYEIWEGPNLSSAWGGPPNPAAYVELLRQSYRSIKAADPRCTRGQRRARANHHSERRGNARC